MKKYYTVEIETKQPLEESFWMYRGFQYDKAKALKCAELLSTFFPSNEYPTKVILYVEDENQETKALTNKTVLKSFDLKDENDCVQ